MVLECVDLQAAFSLGDWPEVGVELATPVPCRQLACQWVDPVWLFCFCLLEEQAGKRLTSACR